MHIYIHRDGQQFGPYPVEQVKDYMESGNLRADDLAWHEGAADWVPLIQIVGEKQATPAAVSPPPKAGQPSSFVPARRNAAGTSKGSSKPVASRAPTQATSGQLRRSRRRTSASQDGYSGRQRSIGLRNMAVGGLFFVGGLAITLFSYAAAASTPGGGTFLITGGAIIFGGIRFVMGIIQFSKG